MMNSSVFLVIGLRLDSRTSSPIRFCLYKLIPITLNEQVKSVELRTWNNAGSTPIDDEQHTSEKHTRTETLNIAAEIATAIKGKVSGSYAGFSAELETQINAKLGVTHNTQEQTETLSEETLKVVIPAWKSVSLMQKQSISDVKQRVSVMCELTAEVRINGGWEKTLPSLESLQLYFTGGGGGTGNADALDAKVATRLYRAFELPFNKVQLNVVKDRLYKDVRTGEINRTEIAINKQP